MIKLAVGFVAIVTTAGCSMNPITNPYVIFRCWDNETAMGFTTKTRINMIDKIRKQVPECNQHELIVRDGWKQYGWKPE